MTMTVVLTINPIITGDYLLALPLCSISKLSNRFSSRKKNKNTFKRIVKIFFRFFFQFVCFSHYICYDIFVNPNQLFSLVSKKKKIFHKLLRQFIVNSISNSSYKKVTKTLFLEYAKIYSSSDNHYILLSIIRLHE